MAQRAWYKEHSVTASTLCAMRHALDTKRFALCGNYRVLHQHDNRHWPDPAGNGRDCCSAFAGSVKIDVSDQTIAFWRGSVGNAIDTDINYDRPFPNHIAGHIIRPSNRGNQYFSIGGDPGETFRCRMADSDRRIRMRILLHQQQSERHANDRATSYNHNMLTGE